MRFRVISKRMTSRGSFFYQARTFADEAANQEKRRLGLIAVQQVQQFRRDGGIRAVIKGNR